MPATATTVVLTFDEAPEADSLTDPAVFAVTVTAGDASSTHTPNSVRISDGSADVRLLLLDRDAIRPGETVSVSYTKPTAPDAIPLQDADGNETAAFTEILMEGGGQLPVYRCDETVRCLNPTLGRVNVPADRGFRARVAGLLRDLVDAVRTDTAPPAVALGLVNLTTLPVYRVANAAAAYRGAVVDQEMDALALDLMQVWITDLHRTVEERAGTLDIADGEQLRKWREGRDDRAQGDGPGGRPDGSGPGAGGGGQRADRARPVRVADVAGGRRPDPAHRTGLHPAERPRLPAPRIDIRGAARGVGDKARSDRRGVRPQSQELRKAVRVPCPAARAYLGGRPPGEHGYLGLVTAGGTPSAGASPARMFEFATRQAAVGTGATLIDRQIVTCQAGAGRLNAQWNAEIARAGTVFGRRIFPDARTEALARAELLAALPAAHDFLIGAARSTGEIMRQQMVLNAVHDAGEQWAVNRRSILTPLIQAKSVS